MREQILLIQIYFPWFFPLFSFIFGLMVGSFLNVCIYRIPLGKSVVQPRSFCPVSGKPIAWYDNIPIISFILLRGKGRISRQPISLRYPLVEVLTATLFLVCWFSFSPGKALCGMIFCSILICATFIDFEHMIIPDSFSIGGMVAGVALAFSVPSLHVMPDSIFLLASLKSGVTALVGAFIGSALVLWIGLLAEIVLRREAMGFGDVKFLGAIGAFCGWQGGIFSIFGGAVIGTIGFFVYKIMAIIIGIKKKGVAPEDNTENASKISEEKEEQRNEELLGREVPFGPMLALAGLLYFIYFDKHVDAYFSEISLIIFGH